MVGVPGRSRACVQCKQRRIACDLRQPECARCLKSKRQCEYSNGHIFVLNVKGGHKTKYRKECAISDLTTLSNERLAGSARSEAPARWERLMIVPSVDKIVRQALLASGISYGQDAAHTSAYFGIISSSLVHSADTALYSPALACYSLWRGRQDGNSTLIDVSRQLYMNGLAATKYALENPKSALEDVTLAACHALGLYEALECPDRSATAYMWHRAACCQLVRLRGPHAHRKGLGHDLFVTVRVFAVMEALERGEPLYLADEAWMNIPWRERPKTLFDKIIDICMDAPAIVRKAHGFEYLPPSDHANLAISLVSDMAALIHKFDVFYYDFAKLYEGAQLFWEQEEPESGYVVEDRDGTSSILNFKPTLCFSDLDTASMLFMYWSSQVSLWAGLADLSNLASQLCILETYYSVIRSHLGQDTALSPEAMQARWIDMAHKVCGSVAYCTSPAALETGPPRIATALNIIIETLKNRKQYQSERAWALKAREEIARRWIRLMGVL